MEFTKQGYIAQISVFLKQEDSEKAYKLSKEFVNKFPNDVITHFLLCQSAYVVRKFDEAALQGRMAFNKSSSYDDMLACTILTASAYYENGKIVEGWEMLKFMERRKTNENLEKLLFIYSLAVKNKNEAVNHLNELHRINDKAADELVIKYLVK